MSARIAVVAARRVYSKHRAPGACAVSASPHPRTVQKGSAWQGKEVGRKKLAKGSTAAMKERLQSQQKHTHARTRTHARTHAHARHPTLAHAAAPNLRAPHAQFSAATFMLHSVLKKVDLPTLGRPTMPILTLLLGRPWGGEGGGGRGRCVCLRLRGSECAKGGAAGRGGKRTSRLRLGASSFLGGIFEGEEFYEVVGGDRIFARGNHYFPEGAGGGPRGRLVLRRCGALAYQ